MLGKFFYGQLSLHEAFWKFSVLGIFGIGALCQLLLRLLRQTVNYDLNFFRVAFNSIANTKVLAFVLFYSATFLTLIAYSLVCIIAMWRTYKEYDKSKTLAVICMILVWIEAYWAIKLAIY